METEQQIAGEQSKNDGLKKGAKIALVILLLNIVGKLATVYQTRYVLVSPLIPESTIWEINKQFVFQALISAIGSIVGLLLYFFGKYLFVIILAASLLVVGRFINI